MPVINLMENIQWSFSSVGCQRIDDRILGIFREAGIKNIGISLLGGEWVNIDRTAVWCKQKGIKIFSGDLPDFNWNTSRLAYDWKMINQDRPGWTEFDWRRWWKYLAMIGFQFTVWRLYGGIKSTGSFFRQIKKFNYHMDAIDGRLWLRWDSRSLMENKNLLVEINSMIENDDYGKINLMIEYYPESSKPIDFFRCLQILKKRLSHIDINLSFDPVHYERAKRFYPEIKAFFPVDYLMYICNHPELAAGWRMLEVSNISRESGLAHSGLNGKIDFYHIFVILGNALRHDLIKKPFQVVFEISPLILKSFLEEGRNYLSNLIAALYDRDEYILLKDEIGSHPSYKKIEI